MSQNNQIKEVVLHVGLHKTGSSSVQSTLYNNDNNELLLNEGILYPSCWPRNQGFAICSPFDSKPEKFYPNRFPRMLSQEEIKNKDSLNLEKFEEMLNHSDAKKLIISGEDISKLSRDSLEKMKNYFHSIGLNQAEFKIMIYTRHPVSWAASWLQHGLKEGSVRYETRLTKLKNEELPTLFQDRIGKFVDVFGEKAVNVFEFEKAKTHEMGLVGHFLQELNVNKKLIKQLKQIKKNEGTTMFTGEFMAYVIEKYPLIINGQYNENRHRKDHHPVLQVRGDKFDIPLAEKKEIARITEQDAQWLEKNYGIEYSSEDLQEKEKYKNIDLSLEDAEKIYPILTKPLRDILVEFLEKKLIVEIPDNYKNQCSQLISRLKAQEYDLVLIEQQEARFKDKLNIHETDKGLFYRELALLMESFGQINAARIFMKKASLFRPNGNFIKKKLDEYKS